MTTTIGKAALVEALDVNMPGYIYILTCVNLICFTIVQAFPNDLQQLGIYICILYNITICILYSHQLVPACNTQYLPYGG